MGNSKSTELQDAKQDAKPEPRAVPTVSPQLGLDPQREELTHMLEALLDPEERRYFYRQLQAAGAR